MLHIHSHFIFSHTLSITFEYSYISKCLKGCSTYFSIYLQCLLLFYIYTSTFSFHTHCLLLLNTRWFCSGWINNLLFKVIDNVILCHLMKHIPWSNLASAIGALLLQVLNRKNCHNSFTCNLLLVYTIHNKTHTIYFCSRFFSVSAAFIQCRLQ